MHRSPPATPASLFVSHGLRDRLGRAVLAFALGTATAAGAGTATLAVSDASVAEGNAGTRFLNFTVTRTGDTATRLTVPYKVAAGSATAGVDYLSPGAGAVLRLEPGMSTGTVGVPIVGDTDYEPNETLTLTLGPGATSTPTPAFRQEQQTLDFGGRPGGTAFGDFNADGRPDLAVAVADRNVVVVMLNTGTGAFRTAGAPAYPVGRSPQASTGPGQLVTGDFNNDGRLDIVSVNGNATVTVLLNQGNGVFPTPAAPPTGSFNPSTPPPTYDEAAANASYTPTYTTGHAACAVAAGDYNGDGRLDLAAADCDDNSIKLLFNQGGGTFPTEYEGLVSYPLSAKPVSLAAGDFNADGKADLAVSKIYGNAGLSVLLNQGKGTFQTAGAPEYLVNTYVHALATGDFNGDGKVDLVTANPNGNSATVLLNQGGGVFPAVGSATYPVGGYPLSITVGDLDGDGKPDLATTDNRDGTVTTLLNQGNGVFPAAGAAVYPVGDHPLGLLAGDTDADGRAELVVINNDFFAYTVDVLPNRGNGTFPTARVASYGVAASADSQYDATIALASADFNGDGKPDVAAVNYPKNTVAVLLNKGDGSFPAIAPNYPAGTDPGEVMAGDFNNDGRPDLAVIGRADRLVTVLLNRGDGTFPAAGTTAYRLDGYPGALVVGDFNGDRRPDLAVTLVNTGNAYNPGAVAVLLNKGNGTFPAAGAPTYPAGNGPQALTPGDFNGDGRTDLAVITSDPNRSTSSGVVMMLLNRGDGTFPAAGAPSYPVAPYAGRAVAGDLDGDGRLDLAVTIPLQNTVGLLLNKGNGTFATGGELPTLPTGTLPFALTASDFDADGRLDLAVANAYGSSVSVLLNSGGKSGAVPAFATLDLVRVGSVLFSLVAADFNGDGRPDLATDGGALAVAVLPNTAAPASTVSLARATAAGTIVNDDHTPPDTTPDAFGFQAVTNAAKGVFVTSETVTVQGFDTATRVSVAGGQYAIVRNGRLGNFTADAGQLAPGEGVAVRLVSAAGANAKTTATLTVGGVAGSFAVTTGAADTTPDAFRFPAVTGAAKSASVSSQPVPVTGFDTPTPIRVANGRYAIVRGGSVGAFTTAAGTLNPGEGVVAQATTAASAGATTTVTVTVGGVASTFAATTAPPDTTPDAFTFGTVADVVKSTVVTSPVVAVTGIDAPAPVGIDGGDGSYAIVRAGVQGAFTRQNGTLQPGDGVVVRLTSADAPQVERTTTLTVGGVPGTFGIVTQRDTVPDPFDFGTVGGALPGAMVESAAVTIEGFDSQTTADIEGGDFAIVHGGYTTPFIRQRYPFLQPGDAVIVRVSASRVPGQTASATVTIGGVAGRFSVVTVGPRLPARVPVN